MLNNPTLLETNDWNDIFEKWEDDFDVNRYKDHESPKIDGMPILYGDFQEGCGTEFKEHISMSLWPSQAVIDVCEEWFIISGTGHSLYWKLVVFKDEINVYIRYSQIIASHHVACITENIPQFILDNCEFEEEKATA